MRVCLMIEGQEDVSWQEWVSLAQAAERNGFDALFRSDHYLAIVGPRSLGALDAWTTMAGLAAVTERIRLGTLVSPATFRHPSVLAKSVVTVDHISGGRVELGLGAGWYDDEHHAYGFPFAGTRTRMEVLAEQLEIVNRSWAEDPFSFEGKHYSLDGLNAHPKPVQRPRPNVIVGGDAKPKSAALAARWADEYNTLGGDPGECGRRASAVARAWEEAGRDPEEHVFSTMTGCIVGEDEQQVLERARAWMALGGKGDGDPAEWLAGRPQMITGTPERVIERLDDLRNEGVSRVMLQHLVHRDLDMLDLIGAEVIPNV